MAHGGLALIPEADNGLSLYGTLSVKFPTADDSKGLGTGEPAVGQAKVKIGKTSLKYYSLSETISRGKRLTL